MLLFWSISISLLTISNGLLVLKEENFNSCQQFTHFRLGVAGCVDETLCQSRLSLPGLCQGHPYNVRCCFIKGKEDPPLEEFRAVWIATVENIDWPSSKTESPADQQNELLSILNMVEQLNMNAIVFQVSALEIMIRLLSLII